MKPGYTQLPIKPETRERLLNIGKKGETWDMLLNRMLDEREGQ